MDHVEEFIKSLPDGVQETVRALDTLDEDVCKLEAEFRKELRALERKYEVLEKPLLEKRSALVSGALVGLTFAFLHDILEGDDGFGHARLAGVDSRGKGCFQVGQ